MMCFVYAGEMPPNLDKMADDLLAAADMVRRVGVKLNVVLASELLKYSGFALWSSVSVSSFVSGVFIVSHYAVWPHPPVTDSLMQGLFQLSNPISELESLQALRKLIPEPCRLLLIKQPWPAITGDPLAFIINRQGGHYRMFPTGLAVMRPVEPRNDGVELIRKERNRARDIQSLRGMLLTRTLRGLQQQGEGKMFTFEKVYFGFLLEKLYQVSMNWTLTDFTETVILNHMLALDHDPVSTSRIMKFDKTVWCSEDEKCSSVFINTI
ncbi:uncharacterized protein V6R79_021287 [Siganus canaliculatus]